MLIEPSFENLRSRGIALDAYVISRSSSAGLFVRQHGTMLTNNVFPLEAGGTGFALEVVIVNETNKVVTLNEFRLVLPWPDPDFWWLERDRQYLEYSFPRPGPVGFESSVVLNHRVGRHGRLNPGAVLNGFLFGLGMACLPAELRHRQGVLMELSVFDSRGRCYSLDVRAMVDRGERQSRNGATRVAESGSPADCSRDGIGWRRVLQTNRHS